MGMEVNENFLVQFIINSLPSQYAPFQMGYNTIKDKWNVHELHNMLIQEEASLKKQGDHSINLMGLHKFNVSSTQVHKKEHKNDKCHFYKKPGHYQKDCLKGNAWFKKKGIPSDPNHKSK
ncbi:hypothetical protein AAG906_034433 [Vitis piasezkii]